MYINLLKHMFFLINKYLFKPVTLHTVQSRNNFLLNTFSFSLHKIRTYIWCMYDRRYIFVVFYVLHSAVCVFIPSLPRRSFSTAVTLCDAYKSEGIAVRCERCDRCSPRKEPPFPPISNFISTATISPRSSAHPSSRPLIAVWSIEILRHRNSTSRDKRTYVL